MFSWNFSRSLWFFDCSQTLNKKGTWDSTPASDGNYSNYLNYSNSNPDRKNKHYTIQDFFIYNLVTHVNRECEIFLRNSFRKRVNIWVFLKCFPWIHWQKIAVIIVQIYNLLCKRPGCGQSTHKTHMKDTIFKLTQIHASVINQIPWLC